MKNPLGGFEAAANGGQHGSIHATLYANNYTKQENQRFTEQFALITDAMATHLRAGISASDEPVQDLIRQHFEFCLEFWTPTKESYKSLAMSYLMPSPYRDTYESVEQGLGKFHYDAIVEWANRNLE